MTVKKTLASIALLGVVVGLAWLGWQGARALGQARSALTDLRSIEVIARDPGLESLPALSEHLTSLETHLKATQRAARPFLWLARRLAWLPQIGPNVQALPPLLEIALELAGAGRQAVAVLMPAAEMTGQPGEGELLSRAVPALAAAAPQLASIETRLARAEELRATLSGPLHPRLAGQLERLDRVLPIARVGLQMAQVAPALLGADGPRTYLILAQNDHELRATGGFISAAGVVRVNGGRITELKITDSYAVDNFEQPHPLPPPALGEQMGIQLLVLRDSNWSPDFPTSAAVARALYEQDQGVATDGAIALDLEAVRLLVGALGPLNVEGIDGPVTAENVIAKMKQAWESPATSQDSIQQGATGDWWRKRKDFTGELMAAALTRLQSGTELNAAALARALLAMLEGRHLQIAVDDPRSAALLAEHGWDGGLRPKDGANFLAIVDSNVGFNKANAAVRQEVAYTVGRTPDGAEATLVITYTHTAPALPPGEPCDRTPRYGQSYDELTERCYWDYLRVYVPGGCELLASEGLARATVEPGEQGTTAFAGNFVLRPGEQHVVALRYRIPQSEGDLSQKLFVRKQGGTPGQSLAVTIGACRWNTTLDRDRVFACGTGSP